MGHINTGAFKPWADTACAHGVSLTSEWFSVSRAAELQAYLLTVSAAGTPKFSLYLHYSPMDYQYLNSITATTTSYVAITLVSDSTSEILQQFDKTGVTDLAYPPRAVRMVATAAADSNDDSVVTAWLLWKE